MRRRDLVLVAGGVALLAAGLGALAAARRASNTQCGPGFEPLGARCCASREGCSALVERCPAPLVMTPAGCDAPATRVHIPAASLDLGPSDWEAEGRVRPRHVETKAFAIDAFEATVGAWACPACPFPDTARFGQAGHGDRARAVSGVTRDEAQAYCASRGGRLPTDDEWIVAAATSATGALRRYPWGDTGAVCRRAAWGLAAGPCATIGTEPDTVGAHPEGATDRGVYDMAGNVAEWIAPGAPPASGSYGDAGSTEASKERAKPLGGLARGGSWRTALATELRTWNRLEIEPGARDDRVGVRCAYDP